MMQLYSGRPEDTAERCPREIAAYDLLDSLGVSYTRVDHAPAATMEDCLAVEQILDTSICKNLFLTNRQHTAYYLLLMPGDKPFKTKELSAEINTARLSFATSPRRSNLLTLAPV